MIRSATDGDIPRLLEMGKAMVADVPAWAGAKLDVFRAHAIVARLVAADGVLVAQTDPPEAEVIGLILFAVAPDPWTGARGASELALYVDPAHRRDGYAVALIDAAAAHAARQGARFMTAGSSLGLPDEAVVGVYTAAGFAVTGRTFRKALVPAAGEG